jgi:parallel beta-helix repeat protein
MKRWQAATDAMAVASPMQAARRTWAFGLGVLALAAAMMLIAGGAPAGASSSATSRITVQAYDVTSGADLPNFTFAINVNNVGDPSSPDPLKQPMTGTPSHSDLVAVGDQGSASQTLDNGKYLISVRAPDHKIWGAYVDLPTDNNKVVRVGLLSGPHPLGKIKIFVFNDHMWTNSAPDDGEEGLAGFHVTLDEQTASQVAVDYWDNPLCTNYLKDSAGKVILDAGGKPTVDQTNPGGDCVTDANGFVQIENLGPATYFAYVNAPDGTQWHQTTTFDGGPGVQTGVRENDPGTGAPLEVPWATDANATTYWFGFAHPQDFANPGTGSVSGTTRNWYGFPPYDTLTMGEPIPNPYVALSDTASNQQVYMGQGDSDGNFNIPNVPPGNYQLSVWDEQNTYIIQFIQVTVTNNGSATDNINLGDVGLPRWFGWTSGDVYFDNNHNGVRDCTDPNDPTTCEPGVANFPMDQRWPNGAMKDATVTDAVGHYEYPINEGGPLGKWFIGETGFTRFSAAHTCGDLGTPCADPSLDGQPVGPSAHDEWTGVATPLPTDEGGGLLNNALVTEGHRSTVDWGKTRYAPNETGQIVGITYFDTTRNEFNARLSAAEGYEPAIPNVRVTLEGLGPDGVPNTADDLITNSYSTDKWHQPKDCPVKDVNGTVLTDLNQLMGPQCIEVPAIGNVSKDGAFDGGYAFADYCPNGYDDVAAAATPDTPCYADAAFVAGHWTHSGAHTGTVALVAGKYITHVWMPKNTNGTGVNCNAGATGGTGDKYISDTVTGAQSDCLYRVTREADVNVDQGQQFVPQIEPYPCTGDTHTVHIDVAVNPRSPYDGAQMPLCDKRLIELKNGQNANADFFLMSNQANGVDVEAPGRIVGFVPDDVYFERDKKSMWYGEPRALANIPIGVYDYTGRLLTTVKTDANGAYEVLVPSTDTWNCPIPQGPCPAMYDVVVNDPGTPAHPNANFNPHYNTESSSWDSWPGNWTQLDTPLIPTAGLGCELTPGTPELLQVSTPVINGAGTAAQRQITIIADNFGSAVGSITLADPRGGANSRTFTGLATAAQLANPQQGGIVSWGGADGRTIIVQVPQAYTTLLGLLNQFLPGQRQLSIATAAGLKSINGITLHVRGTVGTNAYLAAATSVITLPVNAADNPHAIQNAIDAAPDNALIVLSPGTYHENLIMWHPVKLQGLGPGGMTGVAENPNARPDIGLANVQGTVLDGRFFQSSRTAWLATLAAHQGAGYAGINATYPVLEGAGVTVVAKTTTAYAADANRFNAARIDGLEIATTVGARGAGGVQAMAYATNLQITNDVLESDNGTNAGGVALGRPYIDSNNNNVFIGNDRVVGSGGVDFAGGIAIFRGNNNYEIANDNICSNFSFNYGAGVSHWGRSTGGTIHDNQIYYNEGVDSGAGLAIQQEAAKPGDPNQLGVGTGDVTVTRNLIQQNMSGDDGGGFYINRAFGDQIILRNNLIVGNGAANKGGGIQLVDSSNVRIINNTIADNVSTGSSEQSDHNPHAAGLGSDLNSPLYQATLAAGSANFSNPRALFNNILWNNEAWTLQGNGPGATLADNGTLDLEVEAGATDTFHPRYSVLTTPYGGIPACAPTPLLQATACQGNLVIGNGVNAAGFVAPSPPALSVVGSRLNPGIAAVQIIDTAPPTGLAGDYHLTAASPAIDRGAGFSNFAPLGGQPTPNASSIFAPCSGTVLQNFPADVDGQFRPLVRTLRVATPWDVGADELTPGVPILISPANAVAPWSCVGTTG